MKAKKIVSLVLAGAMVFSLAACGSTSTSTTTDTAEETETSAAEETEAAETEEADAEATTTDFTWNEQYEVWAILPTTGVPGLLVHADSMGYVMEKYGFTYVTKDASTSSEVQLIEDAIAAGNVGCLMIATSDQAAIEDACNEATEAGIAVCFLGAEPDGYTIAGYIATAYSITGMAAVQAAEDWVTNRVAEGGDIPTLEDGTYAIALDTYYDIQDGVYRSNAMYGTAEASDMFTVVSSTQSYGDSAQTDAYNNALSVLAANPDCRVFIAYEPDEAMGIASYIETYAADNGLDLADFCVIPCYAEDGTFLSMYDDILADASANAIKGYSTYGGTATEEEIEEFAESGFSTTVDDGQSFSPTGSKLAAILLGVTGCTEDYTWTFGDAYYDDISATNIYGYSYSWVQGDANPCEEYEVGSALYE
ncbi:MAG: substrate-binding domain-containing protein [Clostridiales bacterium]|nr:substrate-binding domain-containing protein [Clostridiales bacterium]